MGLPRLLHLLALSSIKAAPKKAIFMNTLGLSPRVFDKATRVVCLGLLLAIGFIADAGAQSLNFDFGQDQESATGRIVQLILLLTVLSVAPAILMMVTAFTRIVVVLSILRRAGSHLLMNSY